MNVRTTQYEQLYMERTKLCIGIYIPRLHYVFRLNFRWARLAKEIIAFRTLRNFRRNGNISQNTKLRIFKTNVLSALFYGSESWKITEVVLNKLEVFQRKCLRSILIIFWPNIINTLARHNSRFATVALHI